MHKDQREALRRLEEALLEAEETEESWQPEEDDSDEWLEDFYDNDDPIEEYDVYNTDSADVDLDSYSQDVHAGGGGRGCLVFVACLLLVVLGCLIGYLLLRLGVIG